MVNLKEVQAKGKKDETNSSSNAMFANWSELLRESYERGSVLFRHGLTMLGFGGWTWMTVSLIAVLPLRRAIEFEMTLAEQERLQKEMAGGAGEVPLGALPPLPDLPPTPQRK